MGLRYHHCHIQMRSIEESLAFFCGQLGLVELDRVVVESADLTLLYLAAPEDMSGNGQAAMLELAFYHDQRPICDGNRFAHIAFSVENLAYYCRQLEEQGVTILQAPVDDTYAYIQATDGLVLELLQS